MQYRVESYLRQRCFLSTREMSLGIELALHMAMIDHYIPQDMTVTLKNELGIDSVDDLADMQWSAVLRTPDEYHQRIMDLRNFYKHENATMWTYPSVD